MAPASTRQLRRARWCSTGRRRWPTPLAASGSVRVHAGDDERLAVDDGRHHAVPLRPAGHDRLDRRRVGPRTPEVVAYQVDDDDLVTASYGELTDAETAIMRSEGTVEIVSGALPRRVRSFLASSTSSRSRSATRPASPPTRWRRRRSASTSRRRTSPARRCRCRDLLRPPRLLRPAAPRRTTSACISRTRRRYASRGRASRRSRADCCLHRRDL